METLASATQGDCLIALSTWRGWSLGLSKPPELISELSGGLTNQSFLVRTNSDTCPKVVLRLFSPYSSIYGINRSREKFIHEQAAQAGVSPRLIHWDNQLGFSVTEFMEGRVLSNDDLGKPQLQTLVSALLLRYQAIPTMVLPKFDYQRHLLSYAERTLGLLPTSEQQEWRRFRNLLAQWQSQEWPRALSHHDLVAENFIDTDKGLQILDWEYAGLGHEAFDWLLLGLEPPKPLSSNEHLLISEAQRWLNRLWQLL